MTTAAPLEDVTRLLILRRLALSTTVERAGVELEIDDDSIRRHAEALRGAGLVRVLPTGDHAVDTTTPAARRLVKELTGLAMRPRCERCGAALDSTSTAFICTFECTFCARCAQLHGKDCPNCGGELVRRPRRSRGR